MSIDVEDRTTSVDLLYRRFTPPELEVRSTGDGRTIYGIAVPYNSPTKIHENLIESFARGAFNHQIKDPHRVKAARDHMLLGGTLIGAASLLRDDAVGLYSEFRVSKTPVGDETLELVKDGALNQLSIYFRTKQNRRLPGGITQRVTADLREIAVVMEGAYDDNAAVIGIRSKEFETFEEEAEMNEKVEKYRLGLPTLSDHDLEIRRLRLGL